MAHNLPGRAPYAWHWRRYEVTTTQVAGQISLLHPWSPNWCFSNWMKWATWLFDSSHTSPTKRVINLVDEIVFVLRALVVKKYVLQQQKIRLNIKYFALAFLASTHACMHVHTLSYTTRLTCTDTPQLRLQCLTCVSHFPFHRPLLQNQAVWMSYCT
jgi:hypothetical protein